MVSHVAIIGAVALDPVTTELITGGWTLKLSQIGSRRLFSRTKIVYLDAKCC